MKKILVTGANGQLGSCLKKISSGYPQYRFSFASSQELDLTQFGLINTMMRRGSYDVCINCAAYTNVEQAEREREMAFLINAEAVKNLAKACAEAGTVLYHISTDYVFDGTKGSPYTESDQTEPLNVYGASKLQGEQFIQSSTEEFFILRTSWLYSDVGKNFFNTIRNRISEGTPLGVTDSQCGTPTNAYDLAHQLLRMIEQEGEFGIYHYANTGSTTWFGFAKAIVEFSGTSAHLEVNNDYKTLAVRPKYSVLSKEKIIQTFGHPITFWKDSLRQFFY